MKYTKQIIMKKNIFNKYPENLQSEYNSSISTLKNVFDVNDIEKWNQEMSSSSIMHPFTEKGGGIMVNFCYLLLRVRSFL